MKNNGNSIFYTAKILAGTSRVPFLLLAFVCVFVGIAVAVYDDFSIGTKDILFICIGALAAHIAVNVLNEYLDFRSGLDFKTEKTVFSGGSGSLINAPQIAKIALIFGIINVMVVLIVSIYYIILRGPLMLSTIIPGLLCVVLYTPVFVKRPLLSLVSPGIGFGFSMVIGTYAALTGSLSWTIVTVSSVPFFLVSNLLLLNQFPDVEADRIFGRCNVIIKYGKKIGIWIYTIFIVCTILSIIVSVSLRVIPALSLTGIIPLIVMLTRIKKIFNIVEQKKELYSFLGINVLTVLLSLTLVAAGLLFRN
ncbi:MAG TPA: prenyltransferase [Chitinispirillaceae bacterium]|nr:prenyltransferase [Chitinispirillaceae bacterium]